MASPEGQLGGEVRVRLSTISGNATAGIDFESLSNVVTLDQQAPSQSVNIQVFDNVEFEGNKMFSVVAELVSIGERVGITPSVAMTTIIENEQEPRGEIFSLPLIFHTLQYIHVSTILYISSHLDVYTHMHTHTHMHMHMHTHTHTQFSAT